MKDFRGNKIVVGSKVVYPVRYGTEMWMNTAVVENVGKRSINVTKTIYRDGKRVGWLSSGGFGHFVGKAWVCDEIWADGIARWINDESR